MNNKVFYGVIVLIAAGAIGFLVYKNVSSPPEAPTLGSEHADQGVKHVADITQFKYNSNPPSSGDHYQSPSLKGFYEEELPDGNLIHNLEHGYVWVAYRPDLPADQVQKLKGLFSEPFSDPKFIPSKAIVTKRPNNPAPISIVSWRWTMNLDNYDEEELTLFYRQHVSKSPEAAAS
ncbi:hypothetical protein A3A68_02130 [Candidatus Saccharibacteria bacterium RIFCSPLOWO2_01_FULL_48_13]|nr:MAG: hypothetical protein A3A68_02130 [Candidatus Saccharibacteria bacterium RIFCSPLOWO2_01_FULL_48_13]